MKYFTIEELYKSKTATTKGINNIPSAEVIANLKELIEKVLDPLREAYGKPINVNSGYRCPELNKLVNGASNSQHIKGQAADIIGFNGLKEENRKLFNLAISNNLLFDQLIDEKDYSWIHISYSSNPRKQILHL